MVFLLCITFSVHAHDQEGPSGKRFVASLKSDQELLRSRVLTYLRNHGHKQSPLDYRSAAIAAYKARGRQDTEYFDYQRVEVSGIWSYNDTDQTFPGLFDGRILPSQMGVQGSETVLPQWAQQIKYGMEDLAGLKDDSGGDVSAYARSAVTRYKNKTIRDIVAHSWGAEVIYNAIFLGAIEPPKRLILCGVTESNWGKWIALGKYTGTNVIVYDNRLDIPAHLGRGLHNTDGSIYRFRMTTDAEKLDAVWRMACAHITCNKHHRGGKFLLEKYVGLPIHSRSNYYERLLDDGVLAKDVGELTDSQNDLVNREAERLFAIAFAKAQRTILVADERKRHASIRARPVEHKVMLAPPLRVVRVDRPLLVARDYERIPAGMAAMRKLRRLAISACDDGPYLFSEGLNAFLELESEHVHDSHFSMPYAEGEGSDLSGCSKRVYERLVTLIQSSSGDIDEKALIHLVNTFAKDSETPTVNHGAPSNTRRDQNCHWVTVSLDHRRELWCN